MRNPWLRIILKAAGVFLTFAALLAGLAGGTLWWALSHPREAWAFTQRHFLPADLRVTWTELRWTPERLGWFHWRIDWEVKGLKIEKSVPKLSLPIDVFALNMEFSLLWPATRADVQLLRVIAEQTSRLQASGEAGAEPSPEVNSYSLMRGYLRHLERAAAFTEMRRMEIVFKDLRYDPLNGDGYRITLAADSSEGERGEFVQFEASVSSQSRKFGAGGWLNPSRIGRSEPFAAVKSSYEGGGLSAATDLEFVFSDEALKLTGKGPVVMTTAEKAAVKFEPQLALNLAEHQADLSLSTPVTGLPGPLARLEKVDARLRLPMTEGELWSDTPGEFEIKGPVDLFFIDAQMRPALETHCRCKFPDRLEVSFAGQLRMKTLLMEGTTFKRPVLTGRLSVENVKNRLFTMQLAAEIALAREAHQWRIEPRLDSEIHVHSFKGLRGFLDAINILIPAPFDVLDGTIDIQAKNSVFLEPGVAGRTPVTVSVALSSERQKIAFASQVTAVLASGGKGLDLHVKLQLDDFQVQLPPLDPIAGVPRITRDERVQAQPEKPAPPGGFKVALHVDAKSNKPGAIRLMTSYAYPNIPITLNAQRTQDGELLGHVQVEPFDLKYLRRTVHVEQLRVLLDANDARGYPVDGRLRVDQTQYRITIEISGTMKSPAIRLSSEPYLPRSEIISVLLYDRTSDQLASMDAETAGSFEAAMADRAIGLFGLWALASTPIKGFSYNSATKTYTATVQLANGVTAGIGTDWEEASQLEVRKRVSKRWVLTASVSRESEKSQVGRLVLQWEKRF